MSNEFEKRLHIICEMMTFLHACGASDYKADMTDTDGVMRLVISAGVREISPVKLKEVLKILNLPRQREVEEEYWGLFGETGKSGEMTLTGMMLDNAKADYTDGILTITVERHE